MSSLPNFGDKFTNLSLLGQGTFGRVYKALYQRTKPVAIKKIKLDNIEQGMPSTALREIGFLKNLKDHPNIVELIQVIYSSKEKNQSLVFEHYQYDLRKYLKSRSEMGLREFEIKRILYQILRAVSYCHQNKVIHRDLKPQNVLIDREMNVKLADFGLARLLPLPLKAMTPEIQTVWYRAPEILLGQEKYSFSVDIWAIGCIFAELITRKPLLMGNGYEIQQIFKIFEYFGSPTLEQWEILESLKNFKITFPKWKKTGALRRDFGHRIGEMGVDLLERMLCYDPAKRVTAEMAMEHPYFEEVRRQKE